MFELTVRSRISNRKGGGQGMKIQPWQIRLPVG